MDADFRFGIEEEFFLADAETRGTAGPAVRAFHREVHERLPQIDRELMESQIEISSTPSTSFADARQQLAALRKDLADVGRAQGTLILAAGTHPQAYWSEQNTTPKERYDFLTRDLQITALRNVVCGMHVHVEVPEPAQRVALMNRLLPHLPLLLALSASSPFWQGQRTGLAAYRLAVWGEMPRTGLPELFADTADYDRYVATMIQAGAIKDASYLWWAIRPSVRYPTLELRVADSCTRLEDALTIAALYRCLVRRAVRQPEQHRPLTGASRGIIAENLWRAQRDGVRAQFVSEETGVAVAVSDVLESVRRSIADDAAALGCVEEVNAATGIVANGTSSDRQLACFDALVSGGEKQALAAVVDLIAEETAGCL
jgi:glutamate---cysteine ligase / carboxylate-amine ligase